MDAARVVFIIISSVLVTQFGYYVSMSNRIIYFTILISFSDALHGSRYSSQCNSGRFIDDAQSGHCSLFLNSLHVPCRCRGRDWRQPAFHRTASRPEVRSSFFKSCISNCYSEKKTYPLETVSLYLVCNWARKLRLPCSNVNSITDTITVPSHLQ
jgi:hypothetical protein